MNHDAIGFFFFYPLWFLSYRLLKCCVFATSGASVHCALTINEKRLETLFFDRF